MTKANQIWMMKRNDFVYHGENVTAFLYAAKVSEIEEILDAIGDDIVKVTCKVGGTKAEQEKQTAKFARRLSKLSDAYQVTKFTPQVIDGYVMQSDHHCNLSCTITRVAVFA